MNTCSNCSLGGDITSDIEETIKDIEAMKILTEELIPKTEDVKVEEIGVMVDSEILILVLIVL